MNNYDDLLREKDNNEIFSENAIEKHWADLERKMDSPARPAYRKIVRLVTGIAAVSLTAFLGYLFFREKKQPDVKTTEISAKRSAVRPPLNGLNVPYETFSFDAGTGDTLFTKNGSILIFPKHAVLNNKGEAVDGIIQVNTREFNDPFDYSIAGIPMDYDSAGIRYNFVSSAMIDISAYQNGELLRVNPAAKPSLNLVSTSKERNTGLYMLDTVSGKWINKGNEEVNLVQVKSSDNVPALSSPTIDRRGKGSSGDYSEKDEPQMPAMPQKASGVNPTINVNVDPASFRELLVYNGLKFEVMDANTEKVGEDSKTEWDNIELERKPEKGVYKVIFSKAGRQVVYTVKPVLEGKDFEAAEKLYQEKLGEYNRMLVERKKKEAYEQQQEAAQVISRELAEMEVAKANQRQQELNKLILLRNQFIEAENRKILAITDANKRKKDSIEAVRKKQQEDWYQKNKMAFLEQNLVRTFQIDGFGYWNCDQPFPVPSEIYVGDFKGSKNEPVIYNSLCIATEGINRIQNYDNTKNIELAPGSICFGWAFNTNQFYYFTRDDFKRAVRTNDPKTISVSMTRYQGDLRNYEELKGYIFNVNSGRNM